MLRQILTGASAIVAAPIAGLLAHRQWRRARAAQLLELRGLHAIVDERFVTIGGIDMWISVRGEDRRNPVLLELHGGPGASNTIFTPHTRAWQRDFTIVRWDMRGAGKTFGRGGAAGQGALTIARILADAVEVTEYVRALIGVHKVVLLANSFGSIFGLMLARQRPDLYAAYVGTDQNIPVPGQAPALVAAIVRLQAAGRRREAAALTAMGTDPRQWTGHDWATSARRVAEADPRQAAIIRQLMLPALWFSPQHTLRDLRDFAAGMSFSASLFVAAAELDPWQDGTRFELPFFLFQGEHDVLTPVDLAQRWFADVVAPHKDMALIADAAHFASFWRPAQFLELLRTRVRPHLVT